jgi:hypothetical protein
MSDDQKWQSRWTVIRPHQEITLEIYGGVSSCPSVPGVYISLDFGRYHWSMHETMARQLRDWLNANVPDETT